MAKDAASEFILDNFERDDRLAIVLIDRRSGIVMQRIASANHIASPEFQIWLRSENHAGRDVFVSMNALAENARGRTRGDVATIRHLYLDFDENGTRAVQHLQGREDIPKPNYVVNTSPDHWQVSWKVRDSTRSRLRPPCGRWCGSSAPIRQLPTPHASCVFQDSRIINGIQRTWSAPNGLPLRFTRPINFPKRPGYR